jgi:hypothetical protein
MIKIDIGPFKNWISITAFNMRLSYSLGDHGRPYLLHLTLLKKWRLCLGKFGEFILVYNLDRRVKK